MSVNVSSLTKDGYVFLNGNPCKITDVVVSKTGKHGKAKTKVSGTDVFTNRDFTDIFLADTRCSVPSISSKLSTLTLSGCDTTSNLVSLIDSAGNTSIVMLPLEDTMRTEFVEFCEKNLGGEVSLEVLTGPSGEAEGSLHKSIVVSFTKQN